LTDPSPFTFKEVPMPEKRITSPTGKTLHYQATMTTTPKESAEAKEIRIRLDKKKRLEENEAYLADANVAAFLKSIAAAEGGDYDFKYGAVKGKRNDPWRFSDTSTHPGAGYGGKTTAAGMYQITIATWRNHGGKMGLTDFTPKTQDLIAVEMLRSLGVIEQIKAGDIAGAMPQAARWWAALPMGPGLANRHSPQPYVDYGTFLANYKAAGGIGK
jgi:muramidase (phage lysozyme)